KLLHQQPQGDARTREDAQHAEGAEAMQRPRQGAQQEPDGDEIEKHAARPRDAVMRTSAFAIHVLDRYLADRRSVPRRQRRNEAMQLAVQGYLLQNLPPIGFEGRAEVVY